MRVRRSWYFVVIPLAVLLIPLLWPLSSREWAFDFDDRAIRRKEAFLHEERRRWQAESRRDGRPNIVLIVADDLGRDDVGVYGHDRVHTPHIDALAAEGVRFTDATATTAICAPSRASLLTGRYQQRFGFELQPHERYPRNRLEWLVFRHIIDTSPMVPAPVASVPRAQDVEKQGLPPSELTIAELLSARGYDTAAYGKWHLGYDHERFSPLEFGFDEHYGFYEAFSLYAPVEDPSVVNVRIDDFSDNHMWSVGRSGHAAIVHNDRVVTEDEYLTDVFAERAVEFITDSAGTADSPVAPFFAYLPFSAPHTPLQAPREHWDRYADVENQVHRAYYAMITSFDDAVGRVLNALESAGVADNTLVILTSDNGGVTYLGITDNGELAGGKFSTFRGGVAVPLIMRYPGRLPAGKVYEAPVSLMDLFATMDAASSGASRQPLRDTASGERGTGLPKPVDGVNLLPFLGAGRSGAGAAEPHDTLYWRSSYNVAARRGEWKLVRDRRNEIVRLYNIAADPGETTNLAASRPEIVRQLTDDLQRWERGLMPKRWPRVMDLYMDVYGFRYWFGI
jgi:arylsulfatase A-like enzyme